jgi:hypothetical protein
MMSGAKTAVISHRQTSGPDVPQDVANHLPSRPPVVLQHTVSGTEPAVRKDGPRLRFAVSGPPSSSALLPHHEVPPEARHAVVHAMLAIAVPLLPADTSRAALVEQMRKLHQPLGPDEGQMRLCLQCRWAWPCPSLRLLR